ncbi:hypothetical protein TNCV_438301 [Trichonephila clavipes]|nr:hypothetical protein TNCV_438301 [Trichonephila clavipes]
MENNICNSMILRSRRRHFYLVGQSKHKVGACGPDGHGYELVSSVRALVPQKFSVEEELMHVKHVEVKSPHVGVMWKFGMGVISSGHEDSPRQDKIICSMQTLPRFSTHAQSHLGMPKRHNKVTKNRNGLSEGLFAGTPVQP